MSTPGFQLIGLDHVQLAMPAGGETAAREFYVGLLGLLEVPKPEKLVDRGGAWFEGGSLNVHLGIDADFRPARKAHPAFSVQNLNALVECLKGAGVPIVAGEPLAGIERVYVSDPFGNRIELLESHSTSDETPAFRISDRHRLRLPTVADSVELFQLIDSNRRQLRQWLPWLDNSRCADDTRRVIESGLRQFANHQGFHAVICYDGCIVGVVGFHAIDWNHRHTSIGYWLNESHQGRGLMTASCRAISDHAFQVWNMNRIVIRCASGNRRSQAVPERLGFRQEGIQREAEWLYDHFVDLVNYSLLRSDWATGPRQGGEGGTER